jgi:hypothetical protein
MKIFFGVLGALILMNTFSILGQLKAVNRGKYQIHINQTESEINVDGFLN